MDDHKRDGRQDEQTPDDTGLLCERYEDGQRVFDVGTPSLRQLSRRVVVGTASFLLLWAVLTGVGVIPFDFIVTLSIWGLAALFALCGMLDYYRQSQQEVTLRVSEGQMVVQPRLDGLWEHTTGSLTQAGTRAITEQPYEFYCSNAGRFRLPLVPRQLVIVTGDVRVQVGRYLSERELAYLVDVFSATTGWQTVQRVGPVKLTAGIVAGLTVGVLVGQSLGYVAYEYGITPTISQGRGAVGFMAAAAFWTLLSVVYAVHLHLYTWTNSANSQKP